MRNLAKLALVVFVVMLSTGCDVVFRGCRDMCAPRPVDRYENDSCYCAKVNPELRDAGVKK